MYTDPIADYLTRVRNAQMARQKVVEIPASSIKEITKILEDKGYILAIIEDDGKQGIIKIALKYVNNAPAIKKLTSKYTRFKKICRR